jgi:hypothetical protein
MITVYAHADPSGDWGLHHFLPMLAAFTGTVGMYLVLGRAVIRKWFRRAVGLLRSFCTRRPH